MIDPIIRVKRHIELIKEAQEELKDDDGALEEYTTALEDFILEGIEPDGEEEEEED